VRLKSQLAANAGHEALLSFFMQGKDGDVSFVDDLQTRLACVIMSITPPTAGWLVCSASESRTAALEATLQVLDASAPDAAAHCRAEAEARAQLAEANVQLERCRAVLGDPSTLPPDAAQLAAQLQAKEEEARTLRMQVEQHAQVCLVSTCPLPSSDGTAQAETASYAELDRLSAAWEALDKQVKSKVFDLKAMEDRVLKAGSDVRAHFPCGRERWRSAARKAGE
jgi:E3 ubiquitin-protein ligase BRE1